MRTRLFITPGYRFKCVDGLITNFHQPRSTLLPLVAAFCAPDRVRELYAGCLKRGYRFLSYGDACFFR
jgi:S-adenosylmethionine:tRNA ribosyltransferase-isomerase